MIGTQTKGRPRCRGCDYVPKRAVTYFSDLGWECEVCGIDRTSRNHQRALERLRVRRAALLMKRIERQRAEGAEPSERK